MTTQLDEGLAMARFAYYGITTAEDEEEAAMITAKTPGAYRLNKGGKSRGYHERFTWEQVDQLRAEGKSWAEIAVIINVPKPALYNQWCKRNQKAKRRQESKNTSAGASEG